jgi:hypothetical protein
MPAPVQYYLQILSAEGKVLSRIFNLLLLAFLLIPVAVDAQQSGYDEVSITLNIPRIGNWEVSALITGETLFLPVKDVFDDLKIKNSFNTSFDSLQGYIAHSRDVFLIDKLNNTITYGSTVTHLKENEMVSTETGLFLKAPYFGKIFGLDCAFNFKNLSVVVSVKADLPVLREIQQELLRKNLKRLKEDPKPDTTIRRKFSVLKLGMVDWMVTATQQKNNADYTRASMALGGIVAGGEAELYTNYGSNYGFDPRQQYFKWRYVNNEHLALRQISIGRISVPVISTLQGPLTGIQLSNTPTTYRRSFGSYTISNTTKPGWIVELYVDNVLVNYTKADASGFYTFEVPLMYGNSLVKLRFYGPSGEESSQDQMVSVPFNFLPQHQFEYNISAGKILAEQKSRFSRANFNYGVSRSITLGGGMEYLSLNSNKNSFPFINASMRVGTNTIVSAEQAQGVRTKGTLNYRTVRNLQLQLNYTKYQKGQNAVITPFVEERSVILSFPSRAKSFNSFTRLTFQHFLLPEGESTNAELLISTSVNKINSNFTTRAVSYPSSLDVYSELSITCRLPLNVRFTPLIQYEYTGKKISKIKAEVEKAFFNNGAVNLTYEENAITKSRLFGLGIRLNLSAVTSAFSAVHNGNTSTVVESAGGSLIYDGETKFRSFSKNLSVGRAALSIVAFLDLNNNGMRDSKEPAVPGLKFSINGGRVVQEEEGRISRVLDLEAYRKYFLQVDSRSFDNVSWRVKNKTIGVETDPNHVKLIEVPISVVSEASGYVYIKTPAAQKGLSRMIVNFYRGDTLLIGRTLTEQDGFFSFMDLTPGTYHAALDPAQLHLLNFEAAPVSVSFTIANSEEGVIADGFQFTVISHGNPEDKGKQANNDDQSQLHDTVKLETYPKSSIANVVTKKPASNVQDKKILKPALRDAQTNLQKQHKQSEKSPDQPATFVYRKEPIKQKYGADTTHKSYLTLKSGTKSLIVKQPSVKVSEDVSKNGKRLPGRRKESSTVSTIKAIRPQQTQADKKERATTSGINLNKNTEAKINKRKVGSKQVVSSSQKKVVSKDHMLGKKTVKSKVHYQKKKTVPSAEEQKELLEQLQRILKRVKAQKAEMAYVGFFLGEV